MKISRFSNIDVSSTAFRETVDSIIIYLLSIRSRWQLRESSLVLLVCLFLFVNCIIIVCVRAIESLSSRRFTRGRHQCMYLYLFSRRWTTRYGHMSKINPLRYKSILISLFPSFSFPLFSFLFSSVSICFLVGTPLYSKKNFSRYIHFNGLIYFCLFDI